MAKELMVDQVANAMGQDPYRFRRSFVRDSRLLAVLDAAARAANWGKPMAPLTAQGIGIHHEYKGYAALRGRDRLHAPRQSIGMVENGYTGPRVTKVTYAVDVGLPINPLGLEAQMIGGIMDGIAQALTYSLHLQDGYFLEGSWDNAYYTREWNTPARGPGDHHAADHRASRAVPASSGWRRPWRRSRTRTRARPGRCRRASRSITTSRSDSRRCRPCHRYPSHHRRSAGGVLMPTYTFILNGKQVSVDCAGELRLLWVLRDLLGVHGPKYGCGLDVCKACTCHINGKAFNPCSVPSATSEPPTRSPRSRASPRPSASSCIRCSRRGSSTTSRSAATANRVRSWPRSRSSTRSGPRAGRSPTPTSTRCRNICRCGTYPRIREAIVEAAANMWTLRPRARRAERGAQPAVAGAGLRLPGLRRQRVPAAVAREIMTAARIAPSDGEAGADQKCAVEALGQRDRRRCARRRGAGSGCGCWRRWRGSRGRARHRSAGRC